MADPAVHYDRVTDTWAHLLGDDLHYGLFATGDETLADLLVGRDRPAEVGGGVFVRKAGENQTWLASGSYQPNRRAIQWLDRNIVNIDSRRVHRVTMQHADGDGFGDAGFFDQLASV